MDMSTTEAGTLPTAGQSLAAPWQAAQLIKTLIAHEMALPTAQRFARWSAIASLSGMLLGTPAVAQDRSLIDSGNAYLQRELRSLERRTDGPSAGAALQLQLQQTRRDLIRQSRGVYFTQEQAQIFRGLNRVERELRPEPFKDAGGAPALPPAPSLPTSLRDDGPLPSMGDGTLIRRLVARAEAAVAQGRPAQARSDLAAARSLMPGVDPDLVLLHATLAEVRARPAAAGG